MTPPNIVIAGGSGFVGTALRKTLADKYNWICTTRSEASLLERDNSSTIWRQCDLFSLPNLTDAMEGGDKAIYLAHSMLPANRLTQGEFRDLDLLLADNFIRAAEAVGIRNVIFLGTLLPDSTDSSILSSYMSGQLEVERILCSRSIPVTIIRTGIILGPGGSATRLLVNLVKRSPILFLPAWTNNVTECVSIEMMIKVFETCLESEEYTGTFEISGAPSVTYRKIIENTAYVLGRKIPSIKLPADLISFSRFWIRLASGMPEYLVVPLLESFQYSLKAKPNPLQNLIPLEPITFESSIAESIDEDRNPLPNPRSKTQEIDDHFIWLSRRIRSVQRMPLPVGWSAEQVVSTYAAWLSKMSLDLIRHKFDDDGTLSLFFITKKALLLRFQVTSFSRELFHRKAYYITGGILSEKVDPPGRFEIRIFPDINCLVAAVHGFTPKMPWLLYSLTHARVHLFVMWLFRRHMRYLCSKGN